MTLPMYDTVFSGLHWLTNIIINCAMTNKMAQNEYMRMVKHVHINQGKFLLQFLVFN